MDDRWVGHAPTAQMELPWDPRFNALVYVLSGEGSAGVEQHPIHTGSLAVFGRGDFVRVAANHSPATRTALDVLVLGGLPIREPIAWAGPFVMNTKEEVVQAFEDYQRGRMGQIPTVHATRTETGSNQLG